MDIEKLIESGLIDIKKEIASFTLFSNELTGVFSDKEYTLYTLKALSILETITDEMAEEMRIDVEELRKRPGGKRGARFDVLVSFPSHRIDIEIQRASRIDDIPRSMFYLGKLSTDIDEGTDYIPEMTYISAWICDFDMFPERNLPCYAFALAYERVDGIEGTDDTFRLDGGMRLLFINARYDWEGLRERRALTEKEERMRDYAMDMQQSQVDNIRNSITRRILSAYKEEGGYMYDKIAEDLARRHKDVFDMFEAKGVAEGRNDMIKAMLSAGLDVDMVSRLSGLSKQEILSMN